MSGDSEVNICLPAISRLRSQRFITGREEWGDKSHTQIDDQRIWKAQPSFPRQREIAPPSRPLIGGLTWGPATLFHTRSDNETFHARPEGTSISRYLVAIITFLRGVLSFRGNPFGCGGTMWFDSCVVAGRMKEIPLTLLGAAFEKEG